PSNHRWREQSCPPPRASTGVEPKRRTMPMIGARVRIFHIRCLVDFARTYLMAYFLRRPNYILNTERQYRSSVLRSDWPKDRLLCPKDSIYFSPQELDKTSKPNVHEQQPNEKSQSMCKERRTSRNASKSTSTSRCKNSD